jgi:hypothetical protein
MKRELCRILIDSSGTYIDPCHIGLFVDQMSITGTMLPITISGASKQPVSTISNAILQQPVKRLVAAARGKKEVVSDIASRLFYNIPIGIGTGRKESQLMEKKQVTDAIDSFLNENDTRKTKISFDDENKFAYEQTTQDEITDIIVKTPIPQFNIHSEEKKQLPIIPIIAAPQRPVFSSGFMGNAQTEQTKPVLSVNSILPTFKKVVVVRRVSNDLGVDNPKMSRRGRYVGLSDANIFDPLFNP